MTDLQLFLHLLPRVVAEGAGLSSIMQLKKAPVVLAVMAAAGVVGRRRPHTPCKGHWPAADLKKTLRKKKVS